MYKLLSSIFYSNNDEYEEIYLNRYGSESTYRFDFRINKNNAFLLINHQILQLIEKIMELNCELSLKMNKLPEIALNKYAKKCLVDEVRMTNEIEGVHSTRKEINDILKDKLGSKKGTRLYGLVKKYELLTKEDINFDKCEDIRDLYDKLVLQERLDDDSENEPYGKIFRKEKVYVQNPSGKIIHTGIYPEEKITTYMSKALDILNNDDYNFMIRIAIFHYIFGYIHPFYDGNGRVSRFISSYLLSKKLQYLVSYRLSYTIKQNINSYYKSFKLTNDDKNKGDLTMFVIKFFDVLVKSLEDLCESLDEKYNKLNYFSKIGKKLCKEDNKKNKLVFILIQNTLFGDSGISVDELHEISKIGESKIRMSLKELEECDLLYITKDGRKKLYDINLNNLSESNN